MDDRYHELIDEVSQLVADRLCEDAEWLEDEHAFGLDALMFQLMMQIGLAALERVVNRLVVRQVEQYRQEGMHIAKSGSSVEAATILGTLETVSPYMRNPHDGQTARPAKDDFGMVGRGKTPALERALADFGSECSYGDAEQRFEEHYGFSVGRTSILRVTNDVGAGAEEYLESRLETGPADQACDQTAEAIMVQLDGCEIRTGTYMTAMQAGRVGTEGYEADDLVRTEQWKEVRVGLVRCAGEVTKLYVARLDDYETICEELRALATAKGLGDGTQVISPGDGGNGLKEALEEEFPNIQFILDVPHLKEHFYETADAMDISEEVRDRWVARFVDDIWDGEVDDVLDRLRALHQETDNHRLERLIGYLNRFSECVDYADYKANGWPTGSGEVESAHKYIPQARLKLPGACWKVESINPMLAIRVIKKNGWWDDFWDWRVDRQADAA